MRQLPNAFHSAERPYKSPSRPSFIVQWALSSDFMTTDTSEVGHLVKLNAYFTRVTGGA